MLYVCGCVLVIFGLTRGLLQFKLPFSQCLSIVPLFFPAVISFFFSPLCISVFSWWASGSQFALLQLLSNNYSSFMYNIATHPNTFFAWQLFFVCRFVTNLFAGSVLHLMSLTSHTQKSCFHGSGGSFDCTFGLKNNLNTASLPIYHSTFSLWLNTICVTDCSVWHSPFMLMWWTSKQTGNKEWITFVLSGDMFVSTW